MATKEELLARKEERDKKRAAELEALEVEALELEEKYDAAGKTAGVDFAVVTTAVGNFVVAKPDFITAKRFNAVDDKTEEDVIKFVMPSILHPDRAAMTNVFQEHGGIAWKLSLVLLRMYQADVISDAKK